MKTTDQFLAYLLLRLTVGVNFSFHAIARFFAGTGSFRDKMVADFAKTPLPAPLVYIYGTALSYVELLIGLLLTIGLFTRYALVAASLLMISLMIGSSFQQKWDVVSTQLIYSTVLFILVWTQQANLYSVDRTMLGRE
ncbi:DoxX family membrane protein [Fibrella aquatilis]|uniref:DoxX family membrane protein n=1 Tax=Fibrella aquatilis TaxID=2817059 RepID=A0A939G830_9BACT|nr:DoxX family membrane protein [Fibrella aquatilis]MBO0932354.1 DoxX family membrane protein [Fibrella aquatilis]